MIRPVRPVALVILTACMLYPGVTMLFQGLYPLVAGEWFMLVGERGLWFEIAQRNGLPLWIVTSVKSVIGLLWVAGVPGLWAGDWRAYPLVMAAAAGSLFFAGGSMVMGILALVCLIFFREDPDTIPA